MLLVLTLSAERQQQTLCPNVTNHGQCKARLIRRRSLLVHTGEWRVHACKLDEPRPVDERPEQTNDGKDDKDISRSASSVLQPRSDVNLATLTTLSQRPSCCPAISQKQ